jgi:dipeptidyl-peptidase-4
MISKSIILRICFSLFVVTSGFGDTTPSENSQQTDQDAGYLSLERIFTSKEFAVEDFGPARWLEDGSGYTSLEDSPTPEEDESSASDESEDEQPKDIVRYDPGTGVRKIIIPSTRLIPEGDSQPLKIDDYFWSKDGKKLLVFTNTQRVWRRNTRGDYWVLDLASWDLKKLGGDADASTLMFAKFSPDGGRVAYVRQRNLYVQNLKDLRIIQLTEDGSGTIINGTSDWVYEEEFSLRDGFRWSPNGKFIAYWQFNTEGVLQVS